jgi:hypothetical protein
MPTNTEVTEFYLPELPRLLPYAHHPQAAHIEPPSPTWPVSPSTARTEAPCRGWI